MVQNDWSISICQSIEEDTNREKIDQFKGGYKAKSQQQSEQSTKRSLKTKKFIWVEYYVQFEIPKSKILTQHCQPILENVFSVVRRIQVAEKNVQ